MDALVENELENQCLKPGKAMETIYPEPKTSRPDNDFESLEDNNEKLTSDESHETGRWSQEEHARFLEGLKVFGRRKWQKIADAVGTRSTIQVRSHAQKYFKRVKKESQDMLTNAVDHSHNDLTARTSPLTELKAPQVAPAKTKPTSEPYFVGYRRTLSMDTRLSQSQVPCNYVQNKESLSSSFSSSFSQEKAFDHCKKRRTLDDLCAVASLMQDVEKRTKMETHIIQMPSSTTASSPVPRATLDELQTALSDQPPVNAQRGDSQTYVVDSPLRCAAGEATVCDESADAIRNCVKKSETLFESSSSCDSAGSQLKQPISHRTVTFYD